MYMLVINPLLIIVLFFLSIFNTLHAENMLTIDKEKYVFDHFEVYKYEDKTASLSINNVLQIKDFSSVSNNIAEGYTSSAFWYKFDVKNDTEHSLEFILDTVERVLTEVDLYVVTERKTIHYKGGNNVKYEDRVMPHPIARFKVNIDRQETVRLYIRIACTIPVYGSIQISDQSSLAEKDISKSQLMGVYIGATLIFVFYTFFLYVLLREKIYLYYFFYVLSFALWQILLTAVPPFDTYYGDTIYVLILYTLVFAFIFLILFAREILETKKYTPNLDIFFLFFIGIVTLLLLTNPLDNTLAIGIINLISLFSLPLTLIAGIISYRSGNKVALYFLLGHSVFLVFLFPFPLMSIGLIEYNNSIRYAAVAGVFYEAFVFSLALAYRIKLLRDQKVKIENNIQQDLEKQVNIKTKDLKKTQKTLETLNHILESRVDKEIEKNKHQKELMNYKNRLSQMGEMINNIAHQWRQPLNRINSNLAVIESLIIRYPEREILLKKMDNIQNSTQYMSDTIEDFSNFIHSEKKITSFTLKNVTESTLRLLESRISGIKVNIHININEEILSYLKEYQQVLLIILHNSIDNFEDMSIQNPVIDISCNEIDNMICLSVCDNGLGIDENHLKLIFNPYWTTKSNKEGSGLGLYIAKMLVEESMHGELNVTNIQDGLCFTIKVPKKEEFG